jgi:hypothetical protein
MTLKIGDDTYQEEYDNQNPIWDMPIEQIVTIIRNQLNQTSLDAQTKDVLETLMTYQVRGIKSNRAKIDRIEKAIKSRL